MSRTATISLILAMAASGLSSAQQPGSMKGMEKDMDMQKCMAMKNSDMKGMNMKDMDMQKCQAMMNEKGGVQHKESTKAMSYEAEAVVKAVDRSKARVTLAHEAIKSLNWPAMTMKFGVKDKSLYERLAVGKKVHVEFTKNGQDYVVIAVN
ncbi:copper-binding protein [Pseudoduganella sp. UC29_106]|uniref:copper-binding protein n=1 Tax=Pseudoduganella sp. UC29_106 TaxID=3374553 RepID=UPI0037564DB4